MSLRTGFHVQPNVPLSSAVKAGKEGESVFKSLRTVAPGALLGACGLLLFFAPQSRAIPAFSRQYGTSCMTCHIDFPKLNDFGKAFKDAGFKFPKDDDSFLKVAPVMLGAEANKETFPKSVWPWIHSRSSPSRIALQPILSGHRAAFEPIQFGRDGGHAAWLYPDYGLPGGLL
jgi:hypothetical protein